jgi:hypothetical protein
MRDHIRIIGILNIVMGCLIALVGIAGLVVLGGIAGFLTASGATGDYGNGAVAAPLLAMIGVGIAVFFLVLALPSILGGWGLLKFKPWARVLMIVVSVFHLFHVPLGTALGIYGLWALLSEEGRLLFEGGRQNYVPAPVTYRGDPSSPPSTYPPQAPPSL